MHSLVANLETGYEQPHLNNGLLEKADFSKPGSGYGQLTPAGEESVFPMSDLASKLSRCFEKRSFGHGARFQVTPECDQQFAGQGDNADLALSLASVAETPLIPQAKLAFG